MSNKRGQVTADLIGSSLHASEDACECGDEFVVSGEIAVVRSSNPGMVP